MHYTVYTIHYTVYTIHYTVCTIQYTLYTIHYTLHRYVCLAKHKNAYFQEEVNSVVKSMTNTPEVFNHNSITYFTFPIII